MTLLAYIKTDLSQKSGFLIDTSVMCIFCDTALGEMVDSIKREKVEKNIFNEIDYEVGD